MDLKSKSSKWIGNVFHTFKAVCHDLDDITSQETVTYVETVGGTVKRLYSDVVQDLLPSSSGSKVDGLSFNKWEAVLLGNDKKRELTDEKFDISFQEGDSTNVLMDKASCTFEVNDLKDEGANRNTDNVEDYDSNEEPEELDLICPEDKNWFEASLSSDSIETKREIESDLPFPVLVGNNNTQNNVTGDTCVTDFDRISDFSNSLPHSEMNSSVLSVEEKTMESKVVSSTSSLSSEMVHSEDNICYYLVGKLGFSSDPSNGISSSQPLPTLSCDDTNIKLALSSSVLSLESNYSGIPSAGNTASLVASFEDCDEYRNDCSQVQALMSFMRIDEAEDRTVDKTDASMVNIDLSEKAKLEESCITVDNKLLYAVSYRAQKHRSYKKILRDAFDSRKRLRKEYEQLGILFGDDDIESSLQLGNHPLSQDGPLALGSEKSSSSDISEWELL